MPSAVRKIFSIVAAHPVTLAIHELPRVRVNNCLVEGASLGEAFARIKDYPGLVGASEVFGLDCPDALITPTVRFHKDETLARWEHWSNLAKLGELDADWQLLLSGPESFRQRLAREFLEENPQFA